jgi:hypothetical protein
MQFDSTIVHETACAARFGATAHLSSSGAGGWHSVMGSRQS